MSHCCLNRRHIVTINYWSKCFGEYFTMERCISWLYVDSKFSAWYGVALCSILINSYPMYSCMCTESGSTCKTCRSHCFLTQWKNASTNKQENKRVVPFSVAVWQQPAACIFRLIEWAIQVRVTLHQCLVSCNVTLTDVPLSVLSHGWLARSNSLIHSLTHPPTLIVDSVIIV